MVEGSRAKTDPTKVAFRQIIRDLIHGLCAVPKEVRLEWINELFEAGTASDALPPEESVVRMVLSNLDIAEGNANHRREEMKPKLYPIIGNAGVHQRPDGPVDPGSPLPAA